MEAKISSLETQIMIYSYLGWFFVILTLIPVGDVAYDVLIKNESWLETDHGSFIGGVSGTFAALAGVLFVFVAFLGQRISIIQQQIEIQNNIKELKDTRQEIKGQKEQLELQNIQFQIQSFENVFFKLLKQFRIQSKLSFSENYGDENLIEKIKKLYQVLKTAYSSDDWDSLNSSERGNKLGDCSDFALSQGFARVRALIQSSLSILIHLDNNRKIIDHEFYLSMFYISLNVHENRLLFYGYFSDRVKFDQLQLRLYQEFLDIFNSENICSSDDKKLIKHKTVG